MPIPNLRRLLSLIFLSMIVVGPRPARSSEADPPGVLALVGARIVSQTDAGEIEGTVLVRDGRIAAVGPEVEIPEEADRIDGSGLTITPGFIDARSVLWLPPESRQDGGNDGALNILDGVDPYAEDWPEVLRAGVTAVAVQPASSGLLGGRGAVLRVGPGGAIEDLVIRPDAFVQASLGVSSPSTNSILRRQQFDRIERVLDRVKRYKEEWDEYEAAKRKYDEDQEKSAKTSDDEKSTDDESPESKDDPEEVDSSGEAKDDAEPADTDDGADDDEGEDDADADEDESSDSDADEAKPDATEPPKEPDRDAVKEFLVGLLEGKVPLRIEAHREDDVRNAFELAEEFDLTLIVEGLSTPRSAREELVKRRTPMVLGPILESGSRPSYRRDRDRSWPANLLADDSRWALGTYGDRPADSAMLRAHAAAAVARGVPRDRVLRALTIGAAEVLGLADEIGSIAEGRRADLVAFAGDPIDPSVPVALVVSGGEVVYRNPEARPTVEVVEAPVAVVDLDLPDRLPRRYLIQTRRLFGADGRLAPGSLSVADGVIVASGSTVDEADDDLPVYDVGDAILTPGLMTAFSTLGQARAMSESAGADAGFLRSVDAYDPTARVVRSLVRGGVLRAGFAPASVNVVAGAVGEVRLGAADPVVDPVIGTDLVLASSARNPDRYPASLPGQVTLIREFLGLDVGEDPSARRKLDFYLSDPVIDRLDAVRRARAERLRAGDCGAFFEVAERAEVEAALGLAEALQICATLVGPGVIDEQVDRLSKLAEGPGVALILRPIPPGPEATRRLSSVIKAARAGAHVLFAADDAEELRLLAASAVAAGLPRVEAMRALTRRRLAVDDAPEALWSPGAPADFVLWDGSPIDLSSRPLLVVVDGRIVP